MAYLALVILFPFKVEQIKVAVFFFFFFFLNMSPVLGVILVLQMEQPLCSVGCILGLDCRNCLFLNQYCNTGSARLQRACVGKKTHNY